MTWGTISAPQVDILSIILKNGTKIFKMEQKWNKNGGNMLSLVVVLCGCVPYFLVRRKIRHDCFFSRHRNQSSCLSLKVDLLALIVTVAVAMA